MVDLMIHLLALVGVVTLVYWGLIFAFHVLEAYQRVLNKPPKDTFWEDEHWWDQR